MLKKLLSIAFLLLFSPLLFSQTCESSIPETTPTSRFTPNNDGTVLDTKTGLVWKVCSEGQTWVGGTPVSCTGTASFYNWKTALELAQTLNAGAGFAGQKDWRLPNIKELASIAELQCTLPAINEAVFPSTPLVVFWSSSPSADSSGKVWVSFFDDGHNSDSVNKNDIAQVRLVRSGQ